MLLGNYSLPVLQRKQLFNLKFCEEILNNISPQNSALER